MLCVRLFRRAGALLLTAWCQPGAAAVLGNTVEFFSALHSSVIFLPSLRTSPSLSPPVVTIYASFTALSTVSQGHKASHSLLSHILTPSFPWSLFACVLFLQMSRGPVSPSEGAGGGKEGAEEDGELVGWSPSAAFAATEADICAYVSRAVHQHGANGEVMEVRPPPPTFPSSLAAVTSVCLRGWLCF